MLKVFSLYDVVYVSIYWQNMDTAFHLTTSQFGVEIVEEKEMYCKKGIE